MYFCLYEVLINTRTTDKSAQSFIRDIKVKETEILCNTIQCALVFTYVFYEESFQSLKIYCFVFNKKNYTVIKIILFCI